jgi:hypothetical protein
MSTALDEALELEAAARPPKPPAELKVTSAASWQRDEPEPHTLPSGNVAILQRPQLLELLKAGKIPNTLLSAAIAMSQGRTGGEDMGEVLELLDLLVAAAFIEPRVSLEETPLAGELAITDLSDADRNYVLIWAQRGVEGLRRFRLDGAGPLGGGDGGDVRDEAE